MFAFIQSKLLLGDGVQASLVRVDEVNVKLVDGIRMADGTEEVFCERSELDPMRTY